MFGRVQIIVIGTILLFGVISGIYYSWRSSIEREALMEYNQKQLEQSIKDKEELQKKMEAVQARTKEIEKENEDAKKIFVNKINDIATDLNSKEVVEKDTSSSQVLKDTVRKLQGVVK